MRAIFYSFENELMNSLIIEGESAKHLMVVRVKLDEEVLVLNGRGSKLLTRVASINKNKVELTIFKKEDSKPTFKINLAIAAPKKDAFEDILKIAVELGVSKIYPLSSQYSQYVYEQSPRVQRLIESALIQSNNPFLPIIHHQLKLNDYLENLKTPLYFFNSKDSECGKVEKINKEISILIGPEGGFSDAEIQLILSKSETYSIHLPTPIMRAPTALATSIGYLLALG